jgi:hypothetical protein
LLKQVALYAEKSAPYVFDRAELALGVIRAAIANAKEVADPTRLQLADSLRLVGLQGLMRVIIGRSLERKPAGRRLTGTARGILNVRNDRNAKGQFAKCGTPGAKPMVAKLK